MRIGKGLNNRPDGGVIMLKRGKSFAHLLTALAVPALAQSAVAQDGTPKHAATQTETSEAAAARQIDGFLDRRYAALEQTYKDLHAHPEVAFQEVRTAAILAKQMRKLGFEVTEGVGKTGLVAMLRNGTGPTVLVRADMDGLPMEEKTGLTHASKHTQIINGQSQLTAHGCGHDIHMTWWLAAAEALATMKNRWSGTLMFIAQPAEETTSGARAMMADGLFQRFGKPDFGFAAHVSPAPEGQVIVKPGAVTSSSDTLVVTFNGRGAHGSSPDKSIDPIVMGSNFVTSVQTIISRQLTPGTFGVVTVGSFQSGTVGNIIPDTSTLRLTLRSQSAPVRQHLIDSVGRTAKAVSDMAGAPAPTVEHRRGGTIVMNDAALVEKLAPTLTAALGPNFIKMPASTPPFSGSEDFSEFVEAGVPSAFFWIGGYDPRVIAELETQGKPVPVNHSPYFGPRPEQAIRAGAKTLALSVITVAPAK